MAEIEKNQPEDIRSKVTQELEELEHIERESKSQKLPKQKTVFKADSIKSRAKRRGVHNLPDQTNPPMGFDPEKAYDSVFPFIKLPFLQPQTPEDNISFGSPELEPNRIYFGDNLHVLRALKSNSIDLIYIDPPFFSGRVYNQIWGDDNEIRRFYDIWEDGLPSYLVWMNERLSEMKRVLMNNGSIYVHCDWHASHYIKAEMDKIFGYDNFQNEIVWHYGGRMMHKVSQYNRKHDIIFFYSKNPAGFNFHLPKDEINFEEYAKARHEKIHTDKDGRRYLLAPDANMNRTIKQYEDELVEKGRAIDDVWPIRYIRGNAKERMGYPTQKPEELLERVIKASTDEGDIVADFFMGGGTTCAVAQKLKRRFIGCDISRVAASVTLNRLIKDGEMLSGRTASIHIEKPMEGQSKLEMTISRIPDVKVFYLGVYPIDKYSKMNQEDFDNFILTSYGARRFTGEEELTGVMNASTTLLVGPADPTKSISEERLKTYVQDSLRLRYQENIRMKLKVVGWVFPPSFQKYAKVLEDYFYKQNLAVDI